MSCGDNGGGSGGGGDAGSDTKYSKTLAEYSLAEEKSDLHSRRRILAHTYPHNDTTRRLEYFSMSPNEPEH